MPLGCWYRFTDSLLPWILLHTTEDDTVCTPVLLDGSYNPVCLLPAATSAPDVVIKGTGDEAITGEVILASSTCGALTKGQTCPDTGVLMGMLDISGPETKKRSKCRGYCSTLSIPASCCHMLRTATGSVICYAYTATGQDTVDADPSLGTSVAGLCTDIDEPIAIASLMYNDDDSIDSDTSAIATVSFGPIIAVATLVILTVGLLIVRSKRQFNRERRATLTKIDEDSPEVDFNTLYGPNQLWSTSSPGAASRDFTSPYYNEDGIEQTMQSHELQAKSSADIPTATARSTPASMAPSALRTPVGQSSWAAIANNGISKHSFRSVLGLPGGGFSDSGKLSAELAWRQKYYASPAESPSASTAAHLAWRQQYASTVKLPAQSTLAITPRSGGSNGGPSSPSLSSGLRLKSRLSTSSLAQTNSTLAPPLPMSPMHSLAQNDGMEAGWSQTPSRLKLLPCKQGNISYSAIIARSPSPSTTKQPAHVTNITPFKVESIRGAFLSTADASPAKRLIRKASVSELGALPSWPPSAASTAPAPGRKTATTAKGFVGRGASANGRRNTSLSSLVTSKSIHSPVGTRRTTVAGAGQVFDKLRDNTPPRRRLSAADGPGAAWGTPSPAGMVIACFLHVLLQDVIRSHAVLELRPAYVSVIE
jgi:hypothetical protein